MLASHHLRSEKELLDLIFSEGGIVSGSGSPRANEASHCSENEPPPIEIMSVHRVPSRMVPTNLRPMPVDQQPMDIRGEQQETRGRFQHIKEKGSVLICLCGLYVLLTVGVAFCPLKLPPSPDSFFHFNIGIL